MMKKFAAVLIATLSLCGAVNAQNDPSQQSNSAQTQPAVSPEKQALIAELLRVTESRKQGEEILKVTMEEFEKQMPEIILAALSDSLAELTEQERQEFRNKIIEGAIEKSKRIRELFSKRLDFAKLDELTTAVYAKYFTEVELADLIQFYKSSTGQRTLKVMPQMYAESMARSQEVMMPIIKEIMHDMSLEETEKYQKELNALVESHHRARKKPANTKRRPR